MAKKRRPVQTSAPSKSSSARGWMVFYGIVSIVLGVVLWRGVLNLEQTVALVLVLVGLKKIFCGCN